MPFLELQNISVHYGGVQALTDVNCTLEQGEILALMGPNGAGKSTVLKSIFGLVPLAGGQIIFEGRPIVPIPHRVVHRGISFVPQGRRVFSHLTVLENLEIGGFIIRDKKILNERIEKALSLFPALQEKRCLSAGMLSGGQQQMLALARGLIVQPKVLLLDEPSLGLSPKMVGEVFQKIHEIREAFHTSIIIVEHNLKSLLGIVDSVIILHKGSVLAHGPRALLAQSDLLERVALGTLEIKK